MFCRVILYLIIFLPISYAQYYFAATRKTYVVPPYEPRLLFLYLCLSEQTTIAVTGLCSQSELFSVKLIVTGASALHLYTYESLILPG